MADAANLYRVRIRADKTRGGNRRCAAVVLLCLGALSHLPRPILRSDEAQRRVALRRAYPGCGHRFWPDRSKQSASLRFPIVFDRFLSDAQFGQELFMGSAFVMLRPFASFGESLRVVAVTGSSSIGALALARATGSSRRSSIPTAVGTWLGANRSISS
jgi:hypothetical protein